MLLYSKDFKRIIVPLVLFQGWICIANLLYKHFFIFQPFHPYNCLACSYLPVTAVHWPLRNTCDATEVQGNLFNLLAYDFATTINHKKTPINSTNHPLHVMCLIVFQLLCLSCFVDACDLGVQVTHSQSICQAGLLEESLISIWGLWRRLLSWSKRWNMFCRSSLGYETLQSIFFA